MNAPLVSADGMNFIQDDIANRRENFSRLLRGEHEIERFGRCDEDVRRMLQDRRPLGLCCIAGANSAPEFCEMDSLRNRLLVNSLQWNLEVAMDVVIERLERRDVKNADAVFEIAIVRPLSYLQTQYFLPPND